ncbi:insulinoma-associated protein 2 [Mantella aurantiaca]
MPRGFLVKRNRRACGSYRIPCEDSGSAQLVPIVSVLDVLAPYSSILPTCSTDNDKQSPAQRDDAPQHVPSEGSLEKAAPWSSLPYSPVQPVDVEMKKTFYKRYLSSPVTAESFPVSAALTSMEKLLSHHHPFITPESCHRQAARTGKVPPRKHKASRKLHFTDEVTTSPVLGLQIKAEEPEVTPRSPLLRRPPLGEFICQLCKEQYPDPFALAQHKCSRIVRVEYRCPECDKIFSCPANLASHRRWHKPRAMGSDTAKKVPIIEGKENSNGRSAAISLTEQSARLQHQHSADSSSLTAPLLRTASREDTPVCTPGEGNEEAFHCPYCHKRFRRHAYLRKHLLTHQAYSPIERGQLTYPCALCGVHFPSMDIRDKHRLWHAVREELLLPLEEALVAEGGQQIFPCELCPTAFFSSPGLALHINKCHSAEGRQDLPTQIPLGPGR